MGDFFNSIDLSGEDLINVEEPTASQEAQNATQESTEESTTSEETTTSTQVEDTNTEELIDIDENPTGEDSTTNDTNQETTTETEEETSTTTTSEETDTSEANSSLSSLAAVLHEDGILPNLDMEAFGKIESQEDQATALIKAQEDRIEAEVTGWIDNLPDRLKNIIDNYKDGVPLDVLVEADTANLEYGSITEEKLINDEGLQEKLVIQDLMDRNFSEEDAKDMAQSLKDADKLEATSKKSLATLQTGSDAKVEAEKVRAAEEVKQNELNAKNQLKQVNKLVTDTTEIIPGVPLTKNTRAEVISSMTKPIGYDEAGNPVSKIMQVRGEDPIAFEMKLHYLFNLTDGFKDFSKVTSATKTAVTKTLASRLQTSNPKHGGRSVRVSDDNKNSNNSLLESIKRNTK